MKVCSVMKYFDLLKEL